MVQISLKKTFLPLFLAFCVASSKGLIVYNEENLVGFAFLFFVLFSFHRFGSVIQGALDERSSTVATQFQEVYKKKELIFSRLHLAHNKTVELPTIARAIRQATQKAISHFDVSTNHSVLSRFEAGLSAQAAHQLTERKLWGTRSSIWSRLQILISDAIKYFVMCKRFAKIRKKHKKSHSVPIQKHTKPNLEHTKKIEKPNPEHTKKIEKPNPGNLNPKPKPNPEHTKKIEKPNPGNAASKPKPNPANVNSKPKPGTKDATSPLKPKDRTPKPDGGKKTDSRQKPKKRN